MSDLNAPSPLLDLDLNTVDTSFPVIKGGIYDMVFEDSNVADNKAVDGKNWVLKLKTTTPTTGVKGEQFDAGSRTITHTVSLKTVSEKKTPRDMQEIIVKRVATILQAIKPPITGIKGSDIFDGSFETKCKIVNGRSVRVKLDALPERRDKDSGRTLPPGNDITQWIKG